MEKKFALWAILVDPPPPPEGAFFSDWIARGEHAGMDYLARTAERRLSVAAGYPGYRSVVVALLPYRRSAFFEEGAPGQAEIARYAVGEDYHDRFLERFRSVISEVGPLLPAGERPLIKPDHGALLEKSLAQMAGLGVMGKNTLLINERYGSWFTIGCLLLKTPLVGIQGPYDRANPCGSCSRCLSECPTDAFTAPYRLNAGRCLSYLTIERPDDPMADLRREAGSRWLFGCDRCQEVCPHNRMPLSREGILSFEASEEKTVNTGRLISLAGSSEESIGALREEHTALSRVSAHHMKERFSEIVEWESHAASGGRSSQS